MKIILTKPMVVFEGGLKSIGTLREGEYGIKPASPLDDNLSWYQIIGSEKIFGINPKNIPEEIIFKD